MGIDDSKTLLGSGPSGPTPAQLVVIQGQPLGNVFELTADRVAVGRAPDNDVVLGSSTVSRHHARLWREGARFTVEDLGSRNGVLINGRAIPSGSKASLTHKDVLQLSDCRLLFLQGASEFELQRLTTIRLDRSKISQEVDALLRGLSGAEGAASES